MIMAASGSDMADSFVSNCKTPSKFPESLISSLVTGKSLAVSSPRYGDFSKPSRARIQFLFPRKVLISPLWHIWRSGCALLHEGNVFVLKREWTKARCVWKSSRSKSPEK